MDNKKIKISLSTFFLIVAIVIIICMACYIYVEKVNTNKEIDTLQTNSVEMQNTINTLQERINTISKTSNSNSDEEINNSQTSKEEFKYSNDEIKKALQNYLDLVGMEEGSPLGMLVKLGLCKYDDYYNANKTTDNYVKTNIKYSDYKEKMLEYVTEEWFNTNFNNGFYKEQDGILYFLDGGATGINFEVKDVNIKGAYSKQVYIAEVYNIHVDGSKELENIEFHIANNNNNKCVISYCD